MPGSSVEALLRYENNLTHFPGPEFGEAVKLGEALTIVSHPFGYPLDNKSLLDLAISLGLPEKDIAEAKKVITITGFTNRYISQHPNERLTQEGVIDRATSVGAQLLDQVLVSHGWDNIDVFIDTSAFLPLSLNQGILDKAGLDSRRILSRSYRYACAGAIAAFVDCLADPSLVDARIVIAAIEPLSQLIDSKPYTSLGRLAIPAIFGDSNTLIAFTPRRFHLERAIVLVQPDGGVIKLNTQYDVKGSVSNPATIPSHYRFANGGESILRHTRDGSLLNISHPEDGSDISMDGIRTGLFFGDQTASVIINLLNEFDQPDLLKILGDKNVILHPASEPVVNRIAKLLFRQGYLNSSYLPFLMDKAQQSNSSSATTLNRWRYMIQNGMIDPKLPMLWIAPGVGSAIAGAIGWIMP